MKATHEIEVAIPLRQANTSSFLLFIIAAIVYGAPFSLYWGISLFLTSGKSFLTNYLSLLITLVAGIVVHELLHALTWATFCAKGLKAIRFGIDWRHLAPYVHCSEYLRKYQYAYGVAMPGALLGIIPAVFSIITGNGWLMWFGIFFTAGAAGDALTLMRLRIAHRSDEIMDHPQHLGFIIRKKRPDGIPTGRI